MTGHMKSPVRTALSDLCLTVSWPSKCVRVYRLTVDMSEAPTTALYFSISRELDGNSLFPGKEFFYDSIDNQSYAPRIADVSVWAAISDHCENEAFNHCNGDVIVWRYFWPSLASTLASR